MEVWPLKDQDEWSLSLRSWLGLSEPQFSTLAYWQKVSEPHRQLIPVAVEQMIPQEHSH